MEGVVLESVDHGLDPAEGVLLQLIVQPFAELREASVAPRDDDILQVIVPDRGICEPKALVNGVGDAFLVKSDVLWVEENLRDLEALLVQRDVLEVDA